ncbi:single-stranded-DNA-specific exonuclease RecJ, partial [Candidatus Omnitrophota bacterium]
MKKWKVIERTEESAQLAQDAGISRVVAHLLVARSIKDKEAAQRFLYPKRSYLFEPQRLSDMVPAVARIRKAIEEKQKILLFGDYDVDGITSLAMLGDYLRRRGADCEVVIPCRTSQGYGFNEQALEDARTQDKELIIALDCGTNSLILDKAQASGIDVIVVDHHQAFERKLSFLLINPKRLDCPYPFKTLSTGALVFKLISALKGIFAHEYLDLATLSIVCDVAPLVDENRILVKLGLEKMRNDPCVGVASLIESNSIKKESIDTFHLGWILGPRLNASGRIAKAYPSFQLLASSSKQEAQELVAVLDKNNKERKVKSRDLLNQALAKVESEVDLREDYVIVLAEEDWHTGILGIVASNIKERYSRPTFLISMKDEAGKGSGRSIEGFHMIKALERCGEFLKDYGGHKKACGISIDKGQVEDFRRAINKIAKEELKAKDLVAT